MNPDAYWYVLLASVSGGLGGFLVMWNRKRSQVSGQSPTRRCAVLMIGTAASAGTLYWFGKAFAGWSNAYAAVVVITITSWAGLLQSVLQLRIPKSLLKVTDGESVVLRASWTGVRLFGRFLRATPLRHLGGRVFLSETDRDAQAVLRGIHDAESVHVWALLLSCPWLAAWGLQGRWMSVVYGVAVHIPLNVYPVLHLRHVAWRLERHMALNPCSSQARQDRFRHRQP